MSERTSCNMKPGEYGHVCAWHPAPTPTDAEREAREMAEKIAEALKISDPLKQHDLLVELLPVYRRLAEAERLVGVRTADLIEQTNRRQTAERRLEEAVRNLSELSSANRVATAKAATEGDRRREAEAALAEARIKCRFCESKSFSR